MKLLNLIIPILLYVNAATLLFPDNFKAWPIVLLTIFVIIRYVKLSKKPILKTKTYIISIMLFILFMLSLIYSNDIWYGLRRLETSFSLIIFPTIFYLISGDKDLINKFTIRTLKLVFIYTLLFYLIFTFIYFYLTEPYYTFKSTLVHYTTLVNIRINHYTIHPIYLSIYIGIALLFIASIFKDSKKPTKIILFVSLILLTLFISILNKKGPILSLLVLIFLFVAKIKANYKLVFSILAILLLLVSSTFLLPKYNNVNKFEELINISNLDENSSTMIRLQIYNCAVKKITEAPIFGYGFGGEKKVLEDCYRLKNQNLLKKTYNSHNQFLSIFLSTGILGFLIFIYYLYFLLKRSNQKEFSVLYYLTIYFALNMLTENILEREDGLIIISFLINFYLFTIPKPNKLLNKYD